MPDPQLEDSQVLPDEIDIANFQPSSDDSQHDHHIPDTQSNAEAPLHRDNTDQESDSYASRIEETQFARLEPETQSFEQDSLESRVTDTQFANMEIDTQATETQVSPASRDLPFSPETDRVLRSAIADKPISPPSGNEALLGDFIKRPLACQTSSYERYKFAKPMPFKSGQYALPQPQRGEGTSKSQPQQDSPVAYTAQKLLAESKLQEKIFAVQPELPTKTLPPYQSPTPARSDKYLVSQPKQHARDHPQELSARKTPSMPIDPQVKTATTHHVSNLGQAAKKSVPQKLLQRDPQLQPDSQMLVSTDSTASNSPCLVPSNLEHVSQEPLDQNLSSKPPVHVQTPAIPIIYHAPHSRQSPRDDALQKPVRQAASRTLASYQVEHPAVRNKSGLRTPFIASNRNNRMKAPFPEAQRTSSSSRLGYTDSHLTSEPTGSARNLQPKCFNSPFSEVSPSVNRHIRSLAPDHDAILKDRDEQCIRNSAAYDQYTNKHGASNPEDTLDVQMGIVEEPISLALPRPHKSAPAAARSGQPSLGENNHMVAPHQLGGPVSQAPVPVDPVNPNNAITGNTCFQPPSRAASQTPTERGPPRSNISTPISRPMKSNNLEAKDVPEHSALQPMQATKVQKSRQMQPREASRIEPINKDASREHGPQEFSQAPTPYLVHGKDSPKSSFRKFINKAHVFEEMINDYQWKQEEIKKLDDLAGEHKKTIDALEAEKKDLSQKLKKYGTFHVQYKEHMNKVVTTQKILLDEAAEMRKTSAEAIAMYATNRKQSVVDQMGQKIQQIKEMRLQADQLVKYEKDMLARVAKAEETAKKYEKDMLVRVSTAEETARKFTADALAKQEFEMKLNDSSRMNKLLDADLKKNLIELSREHHNSDQLHKQLTAQLEFQKELMTVLKKIPSEVITEFTKDDGSLAKILMSASTTQEKLDQATDAISELKTHQAEPPQSLVKLIEDLCNRIESKVKASDSNEASIQESVNKLFEEFKERLGQLKIDAKTQNGLNDRVSELRESNANLAAGKKASDLEVQSFAARLEQAQQDLDNYQDQLAAKSDELVTAQALPKENPKLLATVQELETTNSGLLGQLQTTNVELTKTKEQLTLIQETCLSNTEHIHTLEGKLEHAQTRIDGFEEEKKAIQAEAKEEVKRKDQDVAKKAELTMSNLHAKNKSTVKNLTQKCSDLEIELKSTKESLQKAQDKCVSTTNNDTLLAEIALYEEKLGLQVVALQRLEGQRLGLQSCGQQIDDDVISIGRGIKGLEDHLISVRNATGQDLDAIFDSQAKVESNFRKLDSLQQENVKYQEKNNNLQKQLEVAQNENREKESLEKAKHALEKELATLRTQLDSAADSKIEDLEKENNALEKQVSHLQAQVESLKQTHHLSKKADMSTTKSTYRETPQQIQRQPTSEQIYPSHPGYEEALSEDNAILRRQMTSPKQMLRAAMKQRTLAPNPQMPATSELNGPGSIPETQSTSQPTAHSSTLRQTSTRPSSNVHQFQRTKTTRGTTVQSALAMKPSSEVGEETEPSRQGSARGVIKRRQSGPRHDGEMLLTPSVASYFQYRAPPAPNSGVDRTFPASAETPSSIKPLMAFSPIGQSPLTDLGLMTEHLESAITQEQLQQPKSKKRRLSQVDLPKKNGSDQGVGIAKPEKVIPESQSFGRGPPYERNSIPLSQQFSDVEETLPKAKKNKTLSAKEESNRRRASGPPPKSAMKNPQQSPLSNQDDTRTTTATASTSVLQDRSARLGKNQNQTQQQRTRYNQGTSGLSSNLKAGSRSSNPAGKSRLPARNRMRSSEGEHRRVSLSNSAPVIPDSQEGHKR